MSLKRCRACAAGADRQVAARVDVAFVRDEADARAGQAAARHRRQMLSVSAPPWSSDRRRLGSRARRDERAAEVAAAAIALRAAGRGCGSSAARRSPSDRSGSSSTARRTSAARARTRRPAASRLGAISRPQPTGTSMKRCSASAPISSARSSSAGSSATLCLAMRRVDLDRDPFLAQVAQAAQRERVRSGQAAERVVRRRHGAVEADRDAREAGVGDLARPPAR